MIKRVLIGIAILAGIILVAISIGWILIMASFGHFDKDYSVSELKSNYFNRQSEIHELKKYYNSIVPEDRFIEIEFKDEKTLGRLGIMAKDSITGKTIKSLFLDWNLKTNSDTVDSLLKTINWTDSTLKEIKAKLDKANCIQIESGEPTKIGFQRSGMGMYSFNVFNISIPDSMKNQYNDSCTYIYVNKNLVLEYGGGAIGPQCFYNFD